MAKCTNKQIDAFTDEDVRKAKARVIKAQATREGVSTADFVLSQVGNSPCQTLQSAKSYLKQLGKRHPEADVV